MQMHVFRIYSENVIRSNQKANSVSVENALISFFSFVFSDLEDD
jgi:hypothetical protein